MIPIRGDGCRWCGRKYGHHDRCKRKRVRRCHICFCEKYDDEPGAYCQDCRPIAEASAGVVKHLAPHINHMTAEQIAERAQRVERERQRVEREMAALGIKPDGRAGNGRAGRRDAG